MKLKKSLAALASAITVASGASAIYASAAVPPSTSPRIYVDFVEEDDGDIRADIIFENFNAFNFAGFHVDFDAGWYIPKTQFGSSYKPTHYSLGTMNYGDVRTVIMNGDSGVFITFASQNNIDYNGVAASIYVEKNSNYNSQNSAANISFILNDRIEDAQGNSYLSSLSNPVMLSSGEYMVGDTNGNNFFNAVDASNVLWFVNHYGSKSVYQVQCNLSTYFPNAVCAEAADANGDGYVTSADAQVIIDAYAQYSTSQTITSDVGKIAIYEIYS